MKLEKLVGVFSDPNRDPRGLVSIAFLARLKNKEIRINREAYEYRWFPLDELPEKIGFDHAKVLERAKKAMESNC